MVVEPTQARSAQPGSAQARSAQLLSGQPLSGQHHSGRGRPLGGSERKRTAIVQAALRLFLRDGFARTSVDAIAAEAGVSKRTIYNHYRDKENLFLSVVGDTYDSMTAVFVVVVESYLADVPDDAVEQSIIGFACEAAMLAARSPDRSAMIRLMTAEAPHFPELTAVQLRPRGVTAAIAERLAILGARGLLEVPVPEDAASHLFSLTMGQMNSHSVFGALELTDAEIRRMATSGARAFLRAYLPR